MKLRLYKSGLDLVKAAKAGNFMLVKQLIDRGVDINFQEKEGDIFEDEEFAVSFCLQI